MVEEIASGLGGHTRGGGGGGGKTRLLLQLVAPHTGRPLVGEFRVQGLGFKGFKGLESPPDT